MVSGSISLRSLRFFSPFPHGTCSLSVGKEYLAFEGGPPIFRQDFTCPALLDMSDLAYVYGAVTHLARLSIRFHSQSRFGWSPFARRY